MSKLGIGILPARHMPLFVNASTSDPRTHTADSAILVGRLWQAGILFEI